LQTKRVTRHRAGLKP